MMCSYIYNKTFNTSYKYTIVMFKVNTTYTMIENQIFCRKSAYYLSNNTIFLYKSI